MAGLVAAPDPVVAAALMALHEVTIQWLSRRRITVEADSEHAAEEEAMTLFREEFFTSRLQRPRDADVLITDTKRTG